MDKKKFASRRATASSMTLAGRMSKKNGKEGNKMKAYSTSTDKGDDDDIFDHVFDTAVEVERVWSISRYFLTNQRANMSPIIFERIQFLKFNADIWDPLAVQKAYDIHIKEKRDKYVKTRVAVAEEQEEDLEYEEEEALVE